MTKRIAKIINIDESLLREAFDLSSYRQVAIKLGIYYCSAAIVQIRLAARKYDIDISHLEKSNTSLETAQQNLLGKTRRRNNVDKKLRAGDPMDYARYILYDCRSYDKKNDLSNDLTLDNVKEILTYGKCSYCDDDKIKLSLDRKDNSLGHIFTNVTVCCIRCNLIRNDMPYEAWQHIVPSIKSARELGLLDNWAPYNRKVRD